MPQLITNGERGFSLVEVLVALVLLTAVVLPTLYTVHRSLVKVSTRLEQQQEAELLLRNVLANPELLNGRDEIDTLTSLGNRMRLTTDPVHADEDSLLFLTILIQQGSTWDTVLCVTKADARKVSVLLH